MALLKFSLFGAPGSADSFFERESGCCLDGNEALSHPDASMMHSVMTPASTDTYDARAYKTVGTLTA
jgi:hypothetical protein